MEFLGICGLIAVSSAALLILSSREKEISQIISALIYVIVFVYVLTRATELWSMFKSFFTFADTYLPMQYLLQAGGVALFGTVTATVCEEVGQKGASRTIETLAMIEILYITFPMIKEIFEKLFKVFGE